MTLDMNDANLTTTEQLEAFTGASHGLHFVGRTRRQKYAWLEKLLQRFWYFTSRKKQKTVIKAYAMKMTGYGATQMTRLMRTMKHTRRIAVTPRKISQSFPRRYTASDIALLSLTDNAHLRLSGKATKEIFRREHDLFGKKDFVRVKDISVAHLYNLRGTRQYVSHASTYTKTNPTAVPIGERRKPVPDGKPGYIRVDSVHQGDQDGEKGVYHINLVDEVTQWELAGCVSAISEAFLLPLLEELLLAFPFVVIEFHSDNGSEYINRLVAKLLQKLLIDQTKSRPRRSNDNALVEGKNGSVIRKHMGYVHIPRRHAPKIAAFYRIHLNVYVNYHRPSGYATMSIDHRGKEKKTYDLYETPYAHFKNMPGAEAYLRRGVSFEKLDEIAYAMSDNACAILMQKAKSELFRSFREVTA